MIAGGDWRYYEVRIPANAPSNWVVTWTRQQGNAHLFIRDTVPPGDGSSVGGGITWASDNKNQGSYPDFASPGVETLTTPPLRSATTYYLGFRSPDDATFSVSCSTNGGAVTITNTIPFLGGSINGDLLPGAIAQYRIDVPDGGTRLKFSSTNSGGLYYSLEQGTVAQPGEPAHWVSRAATINFDQPLTGNWPWLSGCSYYLTVSNTSSSSAHLGVNLALPADLTPISLASAPTAVTAPTQNPTVTVTYTVTNSGLGFAFANWYDRVYLSTNTDVRGTIASWYFWNYNDMSRGGSYSKINSINLATHCERNLLSHIGCGRQ